MEKTFSLYQNIKDTTKTDISLDNYIEIIKNGKYQDLVLTARALKKEPEKYKELKNKMPCITGSAIMHQGSKVESNIFELNNLIVIDIDEVIDLPLLNRINEDRYTFVSHRSFGGDGICVFIKIHSSKFLESFNEIGQYYWEQFNILIDASCKNKNRLRFCSYDPYLFYNEKATKFIAKTKIEKPKKKQEFFFAKDDFSELIEKLKNIDLCQDSYERYCNIGFAIGSHFGHGGLNYFKAICQNGSKYSEKDIEKHYKNFCKPGTITIATLYNYAKAAGIELYSPVSKEIIKRVAVGKANSQIMTPAGVIETLKILGTTTTDEKFIQQLIDSKENFAKNIDNEENDTVKLDLLIKENYPIAKNGFNQQYEFEGQPVNDEIINSITIHAKKYFDFKVSATDISQLIFNSQAKTYQPIEDYFKNNTTTATGDEIEKYADLILPFNEFNRWALKKWLVGAIHNWTSPNEHEEVSPLVLVLCGQQASGKTSFFRNMLPKELRRYFIDEAMEEGGKDVLKRMATSMIMLNDEFGGMAHKDVKNFKKITEKNKITVRLPYGRLDVDLKRRTMLCGTTNEKSVLKDETGNRRVIPIEFESVKYSEAVEFDKDALLKCAHNLYLEGFEFRVFSKEDINYLNQNTLQNLEIEVSEDLFFSRYSFEQTEDHNEEVILNQGEICNEMNLQFSYKATKYDVKRICVKHKMELKSHRINGKVVKGYRLFKKNDFQKVEVPF